MPGGTARCPIGGPPLLSFWALHAQKLEHSFIMASTSMQTWEMGKGLPEGPEWALQVSFQWRGHTLKHMAATGAGDLHPPLWVEGNASTGTSAQPLVPLPEVGTVRSAWVVCTSSKL